MPTDPSRLTSEEARALVAFKREDAGPGLVEARRAAEDEARDLLDGAAGEMTADDLGRLLALFNLDAYRGAPKRWRFTPGFSGAHAQQLVRDLSRLNEAVRSLWRGSLDEALDELDRIMTRRDLPGAGRSFQRDAGKPPSRMRRCRWYTSSRRIAWASPTSGMSTG